MIDQSMPLENHFEICECDEHGAVSEEIGSTPQTDQARLAGYTMPCRGSKGSEMYPDRLVLTKEHVLTITPHPSLLFKSVYPPK